MHLYQISSLFPLSITSLTFLIFTLVISPSLVESSFTPSLSPKSTSSFIDGESFLILGSTSTSSSKISQVFKINLATPWSTTSPDFIELSLPSSSSSPITATNSISSTITADGQGWFIFSDNKGFYFDLNSNTWSGVGPTVMIKSNTAGPLGRSTAVASTVDGTISIIDSNNGGRGGIWTVDGSSVNSNSSSSSSFISHPLTVAKSELVGSSSVAWSKSLKKLILFDSSNYLYTSDIKNDVPSGGALDGGYVANRVPNSPPMLTSSCFIPTGNGTSVVYFGGSDQNNQPTGDVSILDTETWSWTTIRSTDQAKKRVAASCAISNGQLIVWGGYNNNKIVSTSEVLIFDLVTRQWVDQYTPPLPSKINAIPTNSTNSATDAPSATASSDPEPASASNSPIPSSSTSNNSNSATEITTDGLTKGFKIVLIIASVILLLVVLGILFCIRKRKLKKALRRTQFWDSTGTLPLSAASSILGVKDRKNMVSPLPPVFKNNNNNHDEKSDGALNQQQQQYYQNHHQQRYQQQQQQQQQQQRQLPPTPPQQERQLPATSPQKQQQQQQQQVESLQSSPPSSPRTQNLEWLHISDEDDSSTLNDHPSPLYPPTNFCNDSFWSVTVSLTDKENEFNQEGGGAAKKYYERYDNVEGDDGYSYTSEESLVEDEEDYQVYPVKKEVFAFPIPPSSSTVTLDHRLEPKTTVMMMTKATRASAVTIDLESVKSATSHEKREDDSKVGIQRVKTISDNIQICYFPRRLSQHGSLHDVYDTLSATV